MITYFVRRYLKGVKGSGTKDLVKMSEQPVDFPGLVTPFGPGKYILFSRQKGVRGFRKELEHIVGIIPKAFAAESVSVKQSVDVGQISTSQLKTLMSDMISKPQASEDFASDLQTVYAEVMARNDSVEHHAESSGGLQKNHVVGFGVGVGVAALITAKVVNDKNNEISELKGLIEKQSESVAELQKEFKKAEHSRQKAAESAKQQQNAFKSRMGMDGDFLSEYNRANSWR
jgi:hypothetical protein